MTDLDGSQEADETNKVEEQFVPINGVLQFHVTVPTRFLEPLRQLQNVVHPGQIQEII